MPCSFVQSVFRIRGCDCRRSGSYVGDKARTFFTNAPRGPSLFQKLHLRKVSECRSNLHNIPAETQGTKKNKKRIGGRMMTASPVRMSTGPPTAHVRNCPVTVLISALHRTSHRTTLEDPPACRTSGTCPWQPLEPHTGAEPGASFLAGAPCSFS